MTFSIVVTNDGEIDLDNVFVWDLFDAGLIPTTSSGWSMNGQFMNQSDIGPLIIGQSKTLTLYGQVTATTTFDLYNTVTVDARPKNGGKNVTDTDNALVAVKAPSINVEKTLTVPTDGKGSVGTPLTFSIVVTNDGEIDLDNVFVWDLFDAGLIPTTSSGWSMNGQFMNQSDIGPLTIGQSKTLTLYGQVTATTTFDLYNTVTVDARPKNGGQNVTDTDNALVAVKAPSINVEKTLTVPTDGKGSVGTPLTFSIVVTNDGEIDLDNVFVWDLFDAGLIPTTSSGWSMNGQFMNQSDIGPLTIGQSKTLTLYGQVTATTTFDLYNTVTVDARPKNGGKNVTDTDNALVAVKAPSINVEKTLTVPTDGKGSVGTPLTFSIVVTNDGEIDLDNVFVWDLFDAGLIPTTSSGWSMNGQFMNQSDIGPLIIGQSKTLTLYGQVTATTTFDLYNTVTVDARPKNGGQNVTDTDNALVAVNAPSINVEKTLTVPTDGKGSVGTPLTFSIVVTNDGEIDLDNVFVWDLFDAGLIPTTSSGWSMNGQFMNQSDIGPLIIGQSKTLTLYGQVTATTTFDLYNTVTVDARPKNGGQNVTDTDNALVAVNAPSINVEKTLTVPTDGKGTDGTALTYSIEVTNNGVIDLEHVFVWDLFDAGLIPTTSSGWSMNGQFMNQSDIGPLIIGQSKTLTLYGQVTATTTVDLYNTVTVDASPINGGQNVTDSDDASVLVKEPGISVVKTLTSPSGGIGSEGAPLVYSIEVKNTGTIDLEHVFVSDIFDTGLIPTDSAGWIMAGQNMSISDIGSLSAGDSRLLATLNGQIVTNEDKTLLNTVTVEGKPKNGGTNVTATANAPVTAKSASINITKTASPTEGTPGTKINFTIVVTNNGLADLCNVSMVDILPDGLEYLGDDHGGNLTKPYRVDWPDLGCLNSGDSITIMMQAEIDGTVMGDLENVVEVTAVPRGGGDVVRSKAKASVEAKAVPFFITKTSDKKTYRPGEEITYTITVCNFMEFLPLEDVIVKDVFQNPVEIVASYPEPSEDGLWYIMLVSRPRNASRLS